MAYEKKVKPAAAEAKEEVKLGLDTSPMEVEEVVYTPAVAEPVVPQKKKTIDRNQMVECRSVSLGSLTYVSKNQMQSQTEWDSYGDVQWLDVAELISMKSQQKRFLNEPWIVIDDEDIAEYLGLTSMYEKMVEIEDIEGFLTSGVENIAKVLVTLPKGAKELIKDAARAMVASEQLYDTRVIKLLQKELILDLEVLQ